MHLRWIARLAVLIAVLAAAPWGRTEQAAPASAPPSSSLVRVQSANGKTTVTELNQLTTHTGLINFKTRDRLGVYTGRPIVAVGDILKVDLTSRTMTIKIDRELSSMPHVLVARAKKTKVEQALLDRMFPPERTFIIRRTTTMMDGTRPTTAALSLRTQRERFDSLRLKLEDFKIGDRVSVRFIYYENDEKPPAVLNVSKQPRDRKLYEADYRMIPVIQRTTTGTQQTTSSPLPRGLFVPPRLPRGELQVPPKP